MVVFPNAKINLGLNILRRREDGYHDISTVMVPVGWCDILEIVPSKGTETTLTVSGRYVDCPPEKNLVMKALRALSSRYPIPPVDIYLEKIIPDGAGLGGGSADAAFTVSCLNSLFELGLSKDEMAAIAAEVGSDCAFFIYNRPMLATGRGEILTLVELDLSSYSLVIVKPSGCSVSTKEAYGGIIPHKPAQSVAEIIDRPVETWAEDLVNDFEGPIVAIHPTIGKIKQTLIGSGAIYSAMSGSGSSVFGIFPGDFPVEGLSRLFPDMDFFCRSRLTMNV